MNKRIRRGAALAAALGLLLMGAAGAQAAGGLADGEYAIEVTLTGGSGKASVETPTLLLVEDGACYAKLTWSSGN